VSEHRSGDGEQTGERRKRNGADARVVGAKRKANEIKRTVATQVEREQRHKRTKETKDDGQYKKESVDLLGVIAKGDLSTVMHT
jgi:hypothetical protein